MPQQQRLAGAVLHLNASNLCTDKRAGAKPPTPLAASAGADAYQRSRTARRGVHAVAEVLVDRALLAWLDGVLASVAHHLAPAVGHDMHSRGCALSAHGARDFSGRIGAQLSAVLLLHCPRVHTALERIPLPLVPTAPLTPNPTTTGGSSGSGRGSEDVPFASTVLGALASVGRAHLSGRIVRTTRRFEMADRDVDRASGLGVVAGHAAPPPATATATPTTATPMCVDASASEGDAKQTERRQRAAAATKAAASVRDTLERMPIGASDRHELCTAFGVIVATPPSSSLQPTAAARVAAASTAARAAAGTVGDVSITVAAATASASQPRAASGPVRIGELRACDDALKRAEDVLRAKYACDRTHALVNGRVDPHVLLWPVHDRHDLDGRAPGSNRQALAADLPEHELWRNDAAALYHTARHSVRADEWDDDSARRTAPAAWTPTQIARWFAAALTRCASGAAAARLTPGAVVRDALWRCVCDAVARVCPSADDDCAAAMALVQSRLSLDVSTDAAAAGAAAAADAADAAGAADRALLAAAFPSVADRQHLADAVGALVWQHLTRTLVAAARAFHPPASMGVIGRPSHPPPPHGHGTGTGSGAASTVTVPLALPRPSFLALWRSLVGHTFDGFDWSNVLCAGGAVLYACDAGGRAGAGASYATFRSAHPEMMAPQPPAFTTPLAAASTSDVDLFVYGLSPADATAKLQRIVAHLLRAMGVAHDERAPGVAPAPGATPVRSPQRLLVSPYSVTVLGVDGYRHVQVITRCYASPAEVLIGFDVDACCVGFDGRQCWVLPRAARALVSRTNVVDLTRRSTTYESRLLKYLLRGFAIAVPGLVLADVDTARVGAYRARDCRGLTQLLHAYATAWQQQFDTAHVAGPDCAVKAREGTHNAYRRRAWYRRGIAGDTESARWALASAVDARAAHRYPHVHDAVLSSRAVQETMQRHNPYRFRHHRRRAARDPHDVAAQRFNTPALPPPPKPAADAARTTRAAAAARRAVFEPPHVLTCFARPQLLPAAAAAAATGAADHKQVASVAGDGVPDAAATALFAAATSAAPERVTGDHSDYGWLPPNGVLSETILARLSARTSAAADDSDRSLAPVKVMADGSPIYLCSARDLVFDPQRNAFGCDSRGTVSVQWLTTNPGTQQSLAPTRAAARAGTADVKQVSGGVSAGAAASSGGGSGVLMTGSFHPVVTFDDAWADRSSWALGPAGTTGTSRPENTALAPVPVTPAPWRRVRGQPATDPVAARALQPWLSEQLTVTAAARWAPHIARAFSAFATLTFDSATASAFSVSCSAIVVDYLNAYEWGAFARLYTAAAASAAATNGDALPPQSVVSAPRAVPAGVRVLERPVFVDALVRRHPWPMRIQLFSGQAFAAVATGGAGGAAGAATAPPSGEPPQYGLTPQALVWARTVIGWCAERLWSRAVWDCVSCHSRYLPNFAAARGPPSSTLTVLSVRYALKLLLPPPLARLTDTEAVVASELYGAATRSGSVLNHAMRLELYSAVRDAIQTAQQRTQDRRPNAYGMNEPPRRVTPRAVLALCGALTALTSQLLHDVTHSVVAHATARGRVCTAWHFHTVLHGSGSVWSAGQWLPPFLFPLSDTDAPLPMCYDDARARVHTRVIAPLLHAAVPLACQLARADGTTGGRVTAEHVVQAVEHTRVFGSRYVVCAESATGAGTGAAVDTPSGSAADDADRAVGVSAPGRYLAPIVYGLVGVAGGAASAASAASPAAGSAGAVASAPDTTPAAAATAAAAAAAAAAAELPEEIRSAVANAVLSCRHPTRSDSDTEVVSGAFEADALRVLHRVVCDGVTRDTLRTAVRVASATAGECRLTVQHIDLAIGLRANGVGLPTAASAGGGGMADVLLHEFDGTDTADGDAGVRAVVSAEPPQPVPAASAAPTLHSGMRVPAVAPMIMRFAPATRLDYKVAGDLRRWWHALGHGRALYLRPSLFRRACRECSARVGGARLSRTFVPALHLIAEALLRAVCERVVAVSAALAAIATGSGGAATEHDGDACGVDVSLAAVQLVLPHFLL